MNNLNKNSYVRRLSIAVICCAVLSLLLESASSFAAATALSVTPQEALRLGERIYREGVLPSGEPLRVSFKGGISVPGTTFACVSCHLRSGFGSLSDGIYTPPINGPNLFKPFQAYSTPNNESTPFIPRQIIEYNQEFYQKPPNRPVYSDASLADALRGGIDSAGRILNDVMPRYLLEDADMKLLIAYLKQLSSEYSPGVSDKKLRFATIITDDVSPEDRNAMLVPLENFIRNKNLANVFDPRAGIRSAGYRSRLMAEVNRSIMGIEIRELSLSHWVLKGPPETWRSQLEEYYRKEPVFAILGGMTNGEWQPIHKFCEENHIPSIFPITDYPVISQTDWYTLYLSKGYYQEGEGAARFLSYKDEFKDRPIIQIVRDTREGRTLSRGFQETWHGLGHEVTVTVTLKPGEALTEELLQKELALAKPAVIILWDGPESLKALDLLAARKDRPTMVLVSSSYLGKNMLALNEQVRDFTYLTYPYGISQTPEEKSASPMGIKNFNTKANTVTTTRISQQSYILTLVMDMAFKNMKGNYYRDNLLDMTGTIMDLDVPLYERLSFGPGQRYASKGCYIVQLAKPGLIKKIGWMTQ